MTDTNEDRLEEIKKRYELKWDLVFAYFNVNDFQWVIEEVERLRDDSKLDQLVLYETQFKDEIDSLTKKLADAKSTIQKQGELLRDREGNMDGLVQKLREHLRKAERR